jgi:uncharacterized protein YceK
VAIGVGVVVGLYGCATAGTLAEHETTNKVFSGTRRHVELKCAHAACLDLPFSLVADAVLLPVTVPWSIVNWSRSERSAPVSEATEQGETRE